jgi:hypothetical protein
VYQGSAILTVNPDAIIRGDLRDWSSNQGGSWPGSGRIQVIGTRGGRGDGSFEYWRFADFIDADGNVHSNATMLLVDTKEWKAKGADTIGVALGQVNITLDGLVEDFGLLCSRLFEDGFDPPHFKPRSDAPGVTQDGNAERDGYFQDCDRQCAAIGDTFERPCTVQCKIDRPHFVEDRYRKPSSSSNPDTRTNNFEACEDPNATTVNKQTADCGQVARVPDNVNKIKKDFKAEGNLDDNSNAAATFESETGVSGVQFRLCRTPLSTNLDPNQQLDCKLLAQGTAAAFVQVGLRCDPNINPSSSESTYTCNIDNADGANVALIDPDP